MPKRKQSHVTKRGDGRWQAQKTFGYKPNGSPNRKTFYGATATEAAAKLAAYEKQVADGLNTEAASLTLEQWLKIWLTTYKLQSLRPHTYDVFEGFIKNRIIPALGNHKLLRLRPEHLQSFINNLKKDNGENLSVSTIKQIKCILFGALGQATRNGLVTRNSADALSLPKNDKRKIAAFTPGEQAALLNQLKGRRLFALFVVALGAGMRIGEILALRWADVDLIKNEITVAASLSRSKDRDSKGEALKSRIKVGSPKTKNGYRSIPMTHEVKQALLRHREGQAAERLRAGSAWLQNDLVFCTTIGGFLEYRNITRLFAAARDAAGVPKLSFHSLRHSFATNSIAAGVDHYYLSRILGHSSIALTLDTYTDYLPDKASHEMSKMEGVLSLKFA